MRISTSVIILMALFAIPAFSRDDDIMKVTELQELIVKPKKARYKKKGNPAYELYREIREKAPLYDPTSKSRQNPPPDLTYFYDYYEKILLGLNDVTVDPSSKNLGFLANYSAIAYNTGKPVILLSMKEKAGTDIWVEDNKTSILKGKNSVGVDEKFDQENLGKMLDDVLRPVDIFANDIALMQQRFVSPLGRLAGDFYHFSINDTVVFQDDDRRYVELVFAPVNPESFGFNGRMFVAEDSTRFIKKLSMRVPKAINLNYVDNIFITQEFEQDSLGNRHLKCDDMAFEIQLVSGTPSFYARRTVLRDKFHYEDPQNTELIEIQENNSENPELLWPSLRLAPLTQAEERLQGIHEEIHGNAFFYWAEQVILVVAKGYLATGGNWNPGPGARNALRNIWKRDTTPYSYLDSRFDFGPVNTLISYNTLEGIRLRIGGMTTGALSSHVFGRGYAAWGFSDHKWKYELEAEYSFRPKKLHAREFPIHSIRGTHKFDIDMLGQHYLFTNPDNIFLSLKRKRSDMETYQRLSMLEYTLELENHFSIVAGFRHQRQYATGFVGFRNGFGQEYSHYDQSSFFVRLRYAPGEVFYEGRTMRAPINMDAPVIQLQHEFGPRGFLGSAFTLNITELSLQKRFWFSSFGYSDIILKAGKIWSRVLFPALLWPNANLSYTIQPESYSLMNPMEFANDWYASLDLTYWLNGLIFNRIPLVKKAKLREVFTFKILEGGLSHKNNPEYDPTLYLFPSAQSRLLKKTPYMEIGIGIDNILTLLRVDYVWRLTYRDLPGASLSGLRVSLHFSF